MQFVGPLIVLLPLVIRNVGAQSENSTVDFEFEGEGPSTHVWVALMDPTLKNIICGASIIDDKQVLTLARCVSGRNKDDYKLVVNSYPGEGPLSYDVDSVLFRSENSSANNDLAIVTAVQTIRANNVKVPSCLPFRHPDNNFVGSKIGALGWNRSRLPLAPHADLMVYRRMTVSSRTSCNSTNEYLKKKKVCNELSNPASDVYFYGGEPVFWKCPMTKISVQIGIIAFGTSRDGGDPMNMLRIGPFLDWIDAHVPNGKFLSFK